ncbi:Gamma-glutamylputrescine oxidoreductase [Streptomyces sp. RB5]|uniref:Gamma-glutamylputrescine oxidoreductase n=1 Tax=Streptomyces smaragdinus TaxID=2585196 RepID=A0A7K0CEJ0_9ACTN|nr:FAD-dependent oxidoreductase [Streptomyces smaragdinus]MQY11763.1 Gamma-glutamylputrescine oxidoreductase [Streptomyces smaragdinus]
MAVAVRGKGHRASVQLRGWQRPVGRPRHQSLWFTGALAAEPDAEPNPLGGDATADVCVVGGGYTGLWTALRLLEAEPTLRVTVLEADLCGSGASGRNNGGVGNLWRSLPLLVNRLGADDALRMVRENLRAAEDIKAAVETYGIDCELHQRPSGWVATTRAAAPAWRGVVRLAERLGVEAPYLELTPEELREQYGAGPYYAGALQRDESLRIQPAKLARGLRRAVLSLGASVHEHTAVTSIDGAESGVIVRTENGSVRAGQVVLAANAWMAFLPEFRNDVMVVTSNIVATDPIPELLEKRGLTQRPGGFNTAVRVNTGGLTLDGRVQVGGSGHTLAYRNHITDLYDYAAADLVKVEADFRYLYPELRDIPVTHAWSGPVDRAESGQPYFGRLRADDRVHYAIGFTGHGVTSTCDAGHILTSAVLGRDDRWAELGRLYNATRRRTFPPEPVRSMFGGVISGALDRTDAAAKQDRDGAWLDRRVAGLATASLPRLGRK